MLKEAKNYELALSTDSDESSIPSDRLLPPKSLNEGLVKASEQRCTEVREEYPELGPFFDHIVGFNALTSREDLRKAWQATVKTPMPDFNNFIEFLLDIGLIGRAELREKEQGYRFAEIYTHGFKMYRSTRKF